MLTREHLTKSGFKVPEAANADVALDLIQSQPVDLWFSDVNMPRAMKGDVLADWLSTNRSRMPFIVNSGMPKPTLRGPSRYLIRKPYSLSELAHQIRELLH